MIALAAALGALGASAWKYRESVNRPTVTTKYAPSRMADWRADVETPAELLVPNNKAETVIPGAEAYEFFENAVGHADVPLGTTMYGTWADERAARMRERRPDPSYPRNAPTRDIPLHTNNIVLAIPYGRVG